MKKIKHYLLSGIVALSVSGALLVGGAPLVAADPVDVLQGACAQQGQANTGLCDDSGTKLFGPNSFWTRIVNALLFVIAALAVLMIVIGGFRYVVSGGDQGAITSAKNTILYSVIGLVVAFAGYAIVNFVLSQVI